MIENVEYKRPLPKECGTIKVLGYDAGHPVQDVAIRNLNFDPCVETNDHVRNVRIER